MEHRITAIAAQKRNQNRVNIYLDGEYSFSLATIVAAWLKKDQIIDDQKIETLLQADSEEKAFQKALMLLNYRPRSEAEITQRLEKAGFSEDVIAKVRKKLTTSGLLGDASFSKMWIENRVHAHPRSHRLLAYELRKKGVEGDDISRAIVSIPDDKELALQAGMRYARRLEGASADDFRKRMMGFLARKGFNYETIQQVLPAIWVELNQKNGAGTGG